MAEITWYAHQQKFLDNYRFNTSKLLAWDTGTGKTKTAIEWGKRFGEDVLVIVPKALSIQWRREIDTMGMTGFFVITKEDFRKLHKTLRMFPIVIVDEAHYFSGMKSQMTKSLKWYIKRWDILDMLMLTATPYLSTPWNIYTLATILGYKINYVAFKEKFFVDRYIGRRVIPAVREGIEDDIANIVRQIGDVVRLEDCVDVPEQVFETESIALTDEQSNTIESILEINPIVRFTQYHEVENGFLKVPEETVFKTMKHDRIIEYALEHDKLAVVCRYNYQIDRLFDILDSKFDHGIFIIRGDVKDRDAVVQAVEKAQKAIVLIQADCSEGYELPSVGLIVFASMSFSFKNYKQMLGRFLRINRLKKNVFVHLLTKNGVDEAVYDAMLRKQDFDIAIYARNK